MKRNHLSIIMLLLITSQLASACTVMSCSLKGEVFAAANEDDYMGFARMWFNPRTPARYGSVCFGLPDLQAQAAMNEYGLFYDFTAQNIDPSKYHLTKPYNGDLFFEILGKCKTVKEALKFLEKYDYTISSQVLLADAEGNSIIINARTKLNKTGNYQINTNFDICDLESGNYSCRRYDISDEALKNAKKLSAPFFVDILSRTRQEGKLSTIYSNIYDLKRGIIYIYNFHDFGNPYVVDLKKELLKGYKLEKISDHFPASFAYESFTKLDLSIYKKELVLTEIEKNGLSTTIDRYLALAKDTTKKSGVSDAILLEVGIQLIKNAYNRHANGGMWEYWFGFDGGYKLELFEDEQLLASGRIFDFLKEQKGIDSKTRNFIFELSGYVNILSGKKEIARNYYEKASSNNEETWPVSFNRSKKMLLLLADKGK